jgi:hypothetical protein
MDCSAVSQAAAAATAAAAAGEQQPSSDSHSGLYTLDETAVCLHFGREMLRARPDWELQEFEAEWQRRVPEVNGG